MAAVVLPRSQRLVDAAGFTAAVRSGRRAGSRLLVLHHAAGPQVEVGFVVSKAVGNAVVRNRVKRRLRHLVRERLDRLPTGRLVVRAQPAAAEAGYGELASALDRCLQRVGAGPGTDPDGWVGEAS